MTYKRFTFFGGKGGTGKTTCSSAYALHLARQGVRTLAVSTDPAHSLADAFGTGIGSSVVKLEENLWGLEIDAALEAKKYMEGIREQMRQIVSPAIVEEIDKQLRIAYVSPGSEESAIFDCFVDLMERAGEKYDAIVFDTAPTGHTLRLLTLPEVLGMWMEHLLEKRRKAMDMMRLASHYERDLLEKLKEDPVFDLLTRRRDRFQRARDLLTDHELTTFHFVLNAEKLAVLETERAVALMNEFEIAVGPLIVNRVMPPEAGSFFEKRRAQQAQYLEQIQKEFGKYGVVQLPMLDGDIEGMGELEKLLPLLAALEAKKSAAS
ncbi:MULTISPECIES: ArsA family ATPase [unclassified Pyramidobacter]|uniref:ArsA family ATPase n=1 Tax=unclassified Pyramidobacter TaxID=2632171 RepID=UPI00098F39FA|nr:MULTISPECIES: ArsA family ATPase [unclassified Pyramidobacter]OON89690.1 arsenic-transporting ATPase [Pyramidobacter sp. C12-8]RKJ80985.1 arsenic-transporting ATPase [Pyramidobacter sp. CG50-2]WOL39308.1 ArsA family ATPase [Pyramidobacter sp. YE332]